MLAVGVWSVGRSSEPEPTLADAVGAGDLQLADRLLREGASPDGPRLFDLTPLMRAASRDNDDMIEILLRAGADLEAVDGSGLTAWHIAAQLDAVDALSAIVAAGADLDRRSLNGMNALDHAAAWGSLSVLRTLAGLGLDLNTHSEVITQGHGYPRDEGSTPLGIAAWSGQFESVVLLLELGAEVDAPSASGNTPLLMAVFSGQSPEMITVLLEAGANSEATASCVLGCSPGAEEAPDVLGWANALWRTSLVPLLESR